MKTIPKCDKCGCNNFSIAELGTYKKEELASVYFGRSKSWSERALHGEHRYRAMCNDCGELYEWTKNYNLPVMD